ncbi:MAG: hypothetical protein KIS81_09920 [Maricaulaceae bacterium]|nr:hypothetical protein [Maricaulaceae bacterium]
MTIRFLALSAALGALSPAAMAQDAPDAAGQVLACRDIADRAARLDCYDAAAAELARQQQSGDIVIVQRSDVEAVERGSFGMSLPSLPRLSLPAFRNRDGHSAVDTAAADAEYVEGVRVIERGSDGSVQRVAMIIDRVETFQGYRLRFHMQNGQVWRQTDNVRLVIPRRSEPMEAEIRTAALGTYMIRVNNRGSAVRVTREQ